MAVTIPRLDAARVRVRPLTPLDLEACHRLYLGIAWHDPSVSEADNRARRESWLRWTIDSYRELAALNQPPYGERAIERRADGAFLGLVGLVPSLASFGQLPGFGGRDDDRARPEVGLFWALAPEHQGQGYATEAAAALANHALAALRLERLVATTEHDNAASIAVMRRLGMDIEVNSHPTSPWPQVVGVLRAAAGAVA